MPQQLQALTVGVKVWKRHNAKEIMIRNHNSSQKYEDIKERNSTISPRMLWWNVYNNLTNIGLIKRLRQSHQYCFDETYTIISPILLRWNVYDNLTKTALMKRLKFLLGELWVSKMTEYTSATSHSLMILSCYSEFSKWVTAKSSIRNEERKSNQHKTNDER